jgi:hypothetical protein
MAPGEWKQAQRGEQHAKKHHGPGRGVRAGPLGRDKYAACEQPAQYEQSESLVALRLVLKRAVWSGLDRMKCMMKHGVPPECMSAYDSVA